jgi:hypothetical protein
MSVMKRWSDEARQSVKRFIASISKKRYTLNCFIVAIFYPALNTSLPLLSKENHRLTLHSRYFFKEIHCLTPHRRYF